MLAVFALSCGSLAVAEAMLLADTLPFMERLGVRKVVLKSIPICDAGMVGLAAELGFVIKASSGDSHLMVRDGSLPPPDTDCITLPRSFRKWACACSVSVLQKLVRSTCRVNTLLFCLVLRGSCVVFMRPRAVALFNLMATSGLCAPSFLP